MTERQQNVVPRPRRPAPKAASRAAAPRRRPADVRRWARLALVATLVGLPVVVLFLAARSEVFALKHVEVVGATRTPSERIEKVVRETAGARLLTADLAAVRKAVEGERAVESATVVRVLPDTIRVRVEEREPEVVVRLQGGQLAWADKDGHLVSDFRPDGGQIPPPLAGYDDGDSSDRAAADNRDRVATYAAVRDALSGDKLWDWVDEVIVRYPKDAQVRLVESGILVRLGGERFRERLTKALLVVDAAKRGDAEALAGMGISQPNVDRLVAAPGSISQIDATRGGSEVGISFVKAGAQDARRN